MARDLISAKTRIEFREYFVSTTLAKIDDAFRAEGFAANLEYDPPVGGQRRTLVEQYYKSIDWSDVAQVSRVLRVFEAELVALDILAGTDDYNSAWAGETTAALRRWLARDGVVEVGGVLRLPGQRSLDHALSNVDSPELQRQIDRLRSSIEDDPGLAVGTAKELLETVCKTVLVERGVEVDPAWDVPRLVKEVRKILRLLPDDIDESAKGAKSIKRLLSNLGTVANSLSELRNLYGTGHGKHGSAKGVHPRHARLAVGAAATLATFLIETHEERAS